MPHPNNPRSWRRRVDRSLPVIGVRTRTNRTFPGNPTRPTAGSGDPGTCCRLPRFCESASPSWMSPAIYNTFRYGLVLLYLGTLFVVLGYHNPWVGFVRYMGLAMVVLGLTFVGSALGQSFTRLASNHRNNGVDIETVSGRLQSSDSKASLPTYDAVVGNELPNYEEARALSLDPKYLVNETTAARYLPADPPTLEAAEEGVSNKPTQHPPAPVLINTVTLSATSQLESEELYARRYHIEDSPPPATTPPPPFDEIVVGGHAHIHPIPEEVEPVLTPRLTPHTPIPGQVEESREDDEGGARSPSGFSLAALRHSARSSRPLTALSRRFSVPNAHAAAPPHHPQCSLYGEASHSRCETKEVQTGPSRPGTSSLRPSFDDIPEIQLLTLHQNLGEEFAYRHATARRVSFSIRPHDMEISRRDGIKEDCRGDICCSLSSSDSSLDSIIEVPDDDTTAALRILRPQTSILRSSSILARSSSSSEFESSISSASSGSISTSSKADDESSGEESSSSQFSRHSAERQPEEDNDDLSVINIDASSAIS